MKSIEQLIEKRLCFCRSADITMPGFDGDHVYPDQAASFRMSRVMSRRESACQGLSCATKDCGRITCCAIHTICEQNDGQAYVSFDHVALTRRRSENGACVKYVWCYLLSSMSSASCPRRVDLGIHIVSYPINDVDEIHANRTLKCKLSKARWKLRQRCSKLWGERVPWVWTSVGLLIPWEHKPRACLQYAKVFDPIMVSQVFGSFRARTGVSWI